MLGMGVVWLFGYDTSVIFLIWVWYEFDGKKNMTSIELYCLRILYGWKVLILLVFLEILRLDFDSLWDVVLLLNMEFLVEFDLSLIFQWLEGILEGYFDDFSVIRMGKNGVKWAFCRTHYRTRKWGFRRENIRYAVPGFRLLALKCKPRPLLA